MAKAKRNNIAAPDARRSIWLQACQWRAARLLRFTDRQNKERKWINFAELAELYGRNIGIAEGYQQLQQAVIDGKFERNGRSRVLYLHPLVTKAKMTRENMRDIVEVYPSATVQRQYLAYCWIPRELAEAWCRSHNIGVPTPHVSKRQRGRRPYDDSAALAQMRPLVAGGISEREAARIAAAICRSPGASADAIEDRLRGKFADGALK